MPQNANLGISFYLNVEKSSEEKNIIFDDKGVNIVCIKEEKWLMNLNNNDNMV